MLQCTDRLAYLSRSLVLCFEFLFILLAHQLSSSTTMYVQYLSPVNSIYTGRRTAVRFEHKKAIQRDRHNDLLNLTGLKYYHGQYRQV